VNCSDLLLSLVISRFENFLLMSTWSNWWQTLIYLISLNATSWWIIFAACHLFWALIIFNFHHLANTRKIAATLHFTSNDNYRHYYYAVCIPSYVVVTMLSNNNDIIQSLYSILFCHHNVVESPVTIRGLTFKIASLAVSCLGSLA